MIPPWRRARRGGAGEAAPTPPPAPAAPRTLREGDPRLLLDAEGVAHLVFDRPHSGGNYLGNREIAGLDAALDVLERAVDGGGVRAVVVRSAKPAVFVAGADMAEVRALQSAAEGEATALRGQAVLRRLEELPVPTVAAVEGACLGAGVELALACAYRVAADGRATRFAMPEVRFGLLPALGGTVRLPRLVGLRAALELVLEGGTLDARGAAEIGLVDHVLPAARFAESLAAFVDERVRRGRMRTGARRGVRSRLVEDTAPGRAVVFRRFRQRLLEADDEGNPAATRALDVIADAIALPLERAFAREAEAFGELVVSPESRGHQHAFTLRRATRAAPGRGTGARALEHVAVLGGGAPAGAVAFLLAERGVSVRLRDERRAGITEALSRVRAAARADVAARRMTSSAADRLLERVEGATGWGGFGTIEVVVEAVTGGAEAKRQALREAEEHAGELSALATTSLTIPVGEIAEGLAAPERVVGLHLFPSPALPRVAEVVRGPRSSPQAVAAVADLARQAGVSPLVVGDGPGFLLPRLAHAYADEGVRLLEEGASVAGVDGPMVRWGMAMGPLRLADELGTEALARIGRGLAARRPERVRPPDAFEALARREVLGAEAGLGFYRAGRDGRPTPNAGVEALLRGDAHPAPPSPADVRVRLRAALLCEALEALDDGAVPGAAELDLAAMLGIGFPAFRGGLLWEADRAGPAALAEELEALAVRFGPRFAPPARLRRAVEEGRGLYDGGSGET